MIKITALNKFYKSKKRKVCHALKNISITLPDNGLVFVLGKSGSGKSTLLNLIGGLDSISSGSIEVDGNDLATFKEKDFCNYRNTHIGFIFQDYHLIDELTVYENIALSLNLRQIEDKNLVSAALAKVDLAGYEDRYPTELSGGEQQRVAIARAIVKKPRIILADEPTGNLDTYTSTAIISLLKELAQECLILIVSHNVNDAKTYADRIIELKSGEIISDKSRNPEFKDRVTVEGDKLVYPQKSDLSIDDINLINSHKALDIVMRSDKFVTTGEIKQNESKRSIENKNLSVKNELKLSGRFIKNKTLAITLSSFMVAVIMVIMALAQTIITFDSGRIVSNEMNQGNQTSLLMSKIPTPEESITLEQNYRARIDEDDIQAFYDAGYKGRVYPVYNTTIPILRTYNFFGLNQANFSEDIYLDETLGTMVVDEEFFVSKFGKVEYLAKLDNPSPGGVIITDYVADALLLKVKKYRGKTYEDLLGKIIPSTWIYAGAYVNGIIYTGYKENHKNLLDRLQSGEAFSFDMAYNDEDFRNFISDVYDSLGFSYSTDPEYESNMYLGRDFYSSGKVSVNGKPVYEDIHSSYFCFVNTNTQFYIGQGENQVSMSITKYNEIFGTNYTSSNADTFIPHKITVNAYDWSDADNSDPAYSFEATVMGLHNTNDTFITRIDLNADMMKLAGQAQCYAYGLYFDGTEGINKVLDIAEERNFEHESLAIEAVYTMTKAVDVFIPIFELVAIFLCIGVVFILMNFASKMINDKMHDIGIMKALGTKNGSIATVFGMQVLLIVILTCVMATLGYFLFIGVANDVLIESLKRLAPGMVMMDLEFLTFVPEIAVENGILVCILSFVAMIIPMIKIKAIKPVKIIKTKE